MRYIDSNFTNTLEVKQSKFITYLVPYLNYKEELSRLKMEHHKARHFVVAYRYFNDYNQIVEYSSDDGEPKGTSGKPSLFVLQGAELINTAVVVVRYFGGTKLGTGGLVRAYSEAVNLVIESSILKEYHNETIKTIIFNYEYNRKIDYECSICSITIVKKEFNSGVIYELKATDKNFEKFFNTVERMIEV